MKKKTSSRSSLSKSKSSKKITASKKNNPKIIRNATVFKSKKTTSYFSLILELLMLLIALLYFTGYGRSLDFNDKIPSMLSLACYLFILTIFIIIAESSVLKRLDSKLSTMRYILALLSFFTLVLSYFY